MCGILSAQSLAPLGYRPGDGKPFQWYDAGCEYRGKDTTVKFAVSLDTILKPDDGRPVDINGYPATASIETAETCEIDVRVGEDYFSMVLENLIREDPAVQGRICEVAADFARQVAAAAKPT